MANLKLDLLNKIGNEKYYEELELIRLAQEPNMNYKEKVDQMQCKLQNIALLNAELGLVEQYFKEPEPAQQPVQQSPAPEKAPEPQVTNQVPVGQAHNGQSHGE